MKKRTKSESAAQHKTGTMVHLKEQLEEKLAWIQGNSGMPEQELAAKAVRAWLNVIRELDLAQRVCIPTAN